MRSDLFDGYPASQQISLILVIDIHDLYGRISIYAEILQNRRLLLRRQICADRGDHPRIRPRRKCRNSGKQDQRCGSCHQSADEPLFHADNLLINPVYTFVFPGGCADLFFSAAGLAAPQRTDLIIASPSVNNNESHGPLSE